MGPFSEWPEATCNTGSPPPQEKVSRHCNPLQNQHHSPSSSPASFETPAPAKAHHCRCLSSRGQPVSLFSPASLAGAVAASSLQRCTVSSLQAGNQPHLFCYENRFGGSLAAAAKQPASPPSQREGGCSASSLKLRGVKGSLAPSDALGWGWYWRLLFPPPLKGPLVCQRFGPVPEQGGPCGTRDFPAPVPSPHCASPAALSPPRTHRLQQQLKERRGHFRSEAGRSEVPPASRHPRGLQGPSRNADSVALTLS